MDFIVWRVEKGSPQSVPVNNGGRPRRRTRHQSFRSDYSKDVYGRDKHLAGAFDSNVSDRGPPLFIRWKKKKR